MHDRREPPCLHHHLSQRAHSTANRPGSAVTRNPYSIRHAATPERKNRRRFQRPRRAAKPPSVFSQELVLEFQLTHSTLEFLQPATTPNSRATSATPRDRSITSYATASRNSGEYREFLRATTTPVDEPQILRWSHCPETSQHLRSTRPRSVEHSPGSPLPTSMHGWRGYQSSLSKAVVAEHMPRSEQA